MQGKLTSLLTGTWKTCGNANKALINWLKETAPRSTMEYQMHSHGDASAASHQTLFFTKSAFVKLVTKAEGRKRVRNQVANQTQKRNKPHTKHFDEDAKTNVHEKLAEAESSSTRASQVAIHAATGSTASKLLLIYFRAVVNFRQTSAFQSLWLQRRQQGSLFLIRANL